MIRVKRRIDESPLEAFVLNSKRRREEELLPADKDEVSTILKFAGTVQNQVQFIPIIPLHNSSNPFPPTFQTDSISQAKLTKDEARTIVNRVRKEPIDQMRQKKREEQRQNAHNERFRIVNCSRTTTEDGGSHTATTSSATDPAKEITILDIEKDSAVTRSGPGIAELSVDQSLGGSSLASTSRREDTEYVYDLYVPEVGQPELEWSEQFLENMLRFVPVDEEIHLTFSYTYF